MSETSFLYKVGTFSQPYPNAKFEIIFSSFLRNSEENRSFATVGTNRLILYLKSSSSCYFKQRLKLVWENTYTICYENTCKIHDSLKKKKQVANS